MSKCCCSSESCCQPQAKKPINIDFLFLDTTICGRCQDTEKSLDEAVSSGVECGGIRDQGKQGEYHNEGVGNQAPFCQLTHHPRERKRYCRRTARIRLRGLRRSLRRYRGLPCMGV